MILRTKLHIPQTRQNGLIDRAAIFALLNQGRASKLTVVTASGGYGKTTALSQWLQQSDVHAAWVSLDSYDNDLTLFWSYAIAAVNSRIPSFAEAVSPFLSYLQSGAVEFFLTAMINELNAHEEELVIIFDDYHSIELPLIHASVAHFLAYLPAHIHLYITSRFEMPFPTARLQATNQMVRITAAELRFQLDEGVRYFQDSMELPLSGEEIENLVSRTEGWISGMHLAAISLKKSGDYPAFIRDFSGEHRSISDYLFQEAFRLQPEDIQSFLLKTSILNRMNGSLCERVTGQAHGQALLETLDQKNLFIVPLDEERQWFRYHHLFSDFLRRRFRQKHAAESKRVHVMAANWLEEHGFLEEAMEQLLMDGHHHEASAFLEKQLQNLHVKRGVLHRWLRALPEPCFAGKPGIQFLYVKVMVEAGELEAAESRLRLMRDKLLEPEWEPYAGTILYLSAVVSFYRKDFGRTNDYLEKFDRLLPEGSYIQMIEANSYSITFASLLSFFDDLHEAERFFSRWIKTWEERENYPYNGFFYNSYSSLLYEWNRLEEAAVYTERVLREPCMQPYSLLIVIATTFAAQIYQAQGNLTKAVELLEGVKSRIHSADRNIFMRKIEAEKAYLSLLDGSFDESWLQTCGIKHTDTIPLGFEKEYLVLARALMACGKMEEALQLLARLYRLVDENDRLWEKIKVSILQSMALFIKGDTAEAELKLEAALQWAKPGRYIRSFMDEGPKMAELLREFLRKRQHRASHKTAGTTLAYASELLHMMKEHMGEPVIQASLLTRQERKILQMIDMGLTNKQIARQLHITSETVKSHLKSVYRKLDVNNRLQALRKGRELNLL
ncbi:LuxR C-terminal-related transcriptional regulator [Brevibacillus fluminis]|uniref:LuxR C-terminal-related transcriptional regulator n=1 Tax=Brevibacillus fluminis TaxID=511487 RepID=UPI003F8C422E